MSFTVSATDEMAFTMLELTSSAKNHEHLIDFWIDKYTGDIYTFYNGLTMSINIFNPYAENALSFAG